MSCWVSTAILCNSFCLCLPPAAHSPCLHLEAQVAACFLYLEVLLFFQSLSGPAKQASKQARTQSRNRPKIAAAKQRSRQGASQAASQIASKQKQTQTASPSKQASTAALSDSKDFQMMFLKSWQPAQIETNSMYVLLQSLNEKSIHLRPCAATRAKRSRHPPQVLRHFLQARSMLQILARSCMFSFSFMFCK